MVGGGGFECAGGTQAPIGIALPALGGPCSGLEFIKPFAPLTGLQEFLSFSGCLVIGKFLSVEHKKNHLLAALLLSLFYDVPGDVYTNCL
jgi:hypothetical protein